MTPQQVFEMLQTAQITLDGKPALPVSIKEGKFIVISTQKPILGSLYATAEWHYLSAYNVLTGKKKGAFKS